MLLDCLHCGQPSVTGYCSTQCRTTASGDTMRQDFPQPEPDVEYRWWYGGKGYDTIHYKTCHLARKPATFVQDWTADDVIREVATMAGIDVCKHCFNGDG